MVTFCARDFDRRGLFSVPYERGQAALWSRQPRVGFGSLANRSVTCQTRLETRTTESNMCASRRAVQNSRRNKSKGRPSRPAWVGSASSRVGGAVHYRPVSTATSMRRSESVHVGTRKMMNYARGGRSQKKLWWRSLFGGSSRVVRFVRHLTANVELVRTEGIRLSN